MCQMRVKLSVFRIDTAEHCQQTLSLEKLTSLKEIEILCDAVNFRSEESRAGIRRVVGEHFKG